MDLDDAGRLIHQPTRLRIMALLYRRRDLAYVTVRDALGLTDGNLASHVKRLEAAGLMESRRVLLGREGFQLRYRVTVEGSAAFRRYLRALQDVLDEGSQGL